MITDSPSRAASPCEELQLTTADGEHLAARSYGSAGAARGGVIIAPAMGVAQAYYARFAAWLAAEGYYVLTFDYRGIGASRRGPLAQCTADILVWARQDCPAALAALAERVPGRPLTWIGHSLGAQILPFVPGRERLAKVITVAAGSGYWRENTASLRPRAWWLWFVVVPLATRIAGYFPGRRLRKVGDLPRGVIEQWRRWCLDPEYAVGAEGDSARAAYAAVRTPIVALAFTDDEFMSRRNTESLHGFYANAPRVIKRLAPRDLGYDRVGHFGFFRERYADGLWRPHLLPELA